LPDGQNTNYKAQVNSLIRTRFIRHLFPIYVYWKHCLNRLYTFLRRAIRSLSDAKQAGTRSDVWQAAILLSLFLRHNFLCLQGKNYAKKK